MGGWMDRQMGKQVERQTDFFKVIFVHCKYFVLRKVQIHNLQTMKLMQHVLCYDNVVEQIETRFQVHVGLNQHLCSVTNWLYNFNNLQEL